MPYEFNYITNEGQGGDAEFSTEDGSCRQLFRLEPAGSSQDAGRPTQVEPQGPSDFPTLLEVLQKARDVLGFTKAYGDGTPAAGPTNGRLHRVNPLQHPMFQNQYATKLLSLSPVAYGGDRAYEGGVPVVFLPGAKVPDHFAFWTSWDFLLEFKPRPFAVAPNSAIQAVRPSHLYFRPDGTSTNFTYYPEWVRNCEFIPGAIPDDIIQWEQGIMKLIGGAFNGQVYEGRPFFRLPTSALSVHWYAVPLRYVISANSYLDRYQNRVNQYPINFQPAGGIYQAGELLYKSYEVLPHSHPLGEFTFHTLADGSQLNTPEKLCHLVMHFTINRSRLLNVNTPAAFSSNQNVIGNGHNLVPSWRDREFHFVRETAHTFVGVDTGSGKGLFNSAPLELLWADPDSPDRTLG